MLVQDIRYVLRGLARTPAFTFGVVVTLALGIGVNALMFGVVHTLFFRAPEGVARPAEVMRLFVETGGHGGQGWTQATTNYPAFRDQRDRSPAFTQVTAVANRNMSLGRGAEATRVRVLAASPSYFPMLELRPGLGRFFEASDDGAGAAPVAVITWDFWQQRFHGDSAVLGTTLALAKGVYTIVGVTPKGFRGLDMRPTQVILPIETAAAQGDVGSTAGLSSRNQYWLQMIARVQPGRSPEIASQQATQIYRQGATVTSPSDSASRILLAPLQEARSPVAGDDLKVSLWISGVALAVLLIACANVANLLLARGHSRGRELAVRASLGAGRGGLVRLLMTESLLLAVAGGAVGLIGVVWGEGAARNLLIPGLPAGTPLMSPTVLWFAAGAVLCTALLCGLIPAGQVRRLTLASGLREGGRGQIAGLGRTRTMLLGVQMALTLVLLVGAGLFVKSLRNVQALDLGLEAERLVVVPVDLAGLAGPQGTPTKMQLMERLRRLPGVENVAATMGSPFGNSYALSLRVEGRDSLPDFPGGGPYIQVVSPSYLATTGMRIIAGRDFTMADDALATPVAIVNATFAKAVWGTESPIGRCLFVGDSLPSCRRVVGVVETAKRNAVLESGDVNYYLPLPQYADASVSALFVRGPAKPAALLPAIRREIQAANLPYMEVTPLAEIIAPQLRSWRLGAAAFGAFGILALLIAATGVFAILSYSVTQRTREIGVRMALGAQAGQVVGMVMRQGLRVVLVGCVVGLAGAWLLARAMGSLLYGVSPGDASVFLVAIGVLVAAAALASWLPARRATQIDPLTALRAD